MSVEVKVPMLPESVTEATLLTWHKKVGDVVRRDENLVDIETEKVVLEVPAPQDGVIKELARNSGDVVTSDELLAVIEPAKIGAPAAEPSISREAAPEPEPAQTAAQMSPAVRKLVAENSLDISKIPGTGKDGRVTKADVIKFLDRGKEIETAPQPAAAAPASVSMVTKGDRSERREPMSRLRATIAQRLVQAQHTAAMLTTFNDVNLQAVLDLRKKYRDMFEKKHGTRLGFMSFFVKASVEALKRYPAVNGSIEGNDIVLHQYYDIGIAAASPRGLVVPVVRDVDEKSFAELETEIANLAEKARSGTLAMEELTGGTFTITNGGIFGSMLSTPILNPPQSAILGMHRIEQRPVAEDGEVVIRPMMYLALTYDHRIIDGAEAVRFLVTIKESLEDPARLLLEI
jgi:2-oxoglutarate dehydrogenase E2 component (dihydrolipoamide succinyltransferase)